MITAAKRLSQVLTHMGIAYVLAYTVTGSAVSSGLAVLAEPVINVLLLPFHEAAWAKWRRGAFERQGLGWEQRRKSSARRGCTGVSRLA